MLKIILKNGSNNLLCVLRAKNVLSDMGHFLAQLLLKKIDQSLSKSCQSQCFVALGSKRNLNEL